MALRFLVCLILGAQTARADFFQNSQRADMPTHGPVADAMATMTFLGHTCSAFFVANRGNRMLLASARHCANFTFIRACAFGTLKIKTHADGINGVCSKVVAIDSTHDEAIFEATFEKPPANTFLTLSLKNPEGPLEMYGYPNDRARRGAATVTSHCWVNNGIDSSALLASRYGRLETAQVAQATANVRAHEHMIGYNCDVYGGNSGGPVLLAGTTQVIGMPGSYFMNAYDVLPSNYSAYLYGLENFIITNRRLLDGAGVIIAPK